MASDMSRIGITATTCWLVGRVTSGLAEAGRTGLPHRLFHS